MTGIRRIALASLLTLSLASWADDEVKVVTAQGTKTYSMNKLTRIDIGATDLNIVATDGGGTTYAFDDVQKIVIALEATGVGSVANTDAAQMTLTVSADGSQVSFGGWDANEQSPLAIYDASGCTVLQQGAWHGESLNISSLAHGVYVLKAGTHTAKFKK